MYQHKKKFLSTFNIYFLKNGFGLKKFVNIDIKLERRILVNCGAISFYYDCTPYLREARNRTDLSL